MSTETESAHTTPRHPGLEQDATFSRTFLNLGFVFALLISGVCLVMSGIYLFKFLNTTSVGIEQLLQNASSGLQRETLPIAINARLVMARVGLLSCGVLVGLSFGFLGFGLFLLGVRKEMDVAAQYENYQLKLARVSPGVLVIICATILIGVCVTHVTPFSYGTAEVRPAPTEINHDAERTNSPSNTNNRVIDVPAPVDEPNP